MALRNAAFPATIVVPIRAIQSNRLCRYGTSAGSGIALSGHHSAGWTDLMPKCDYSPHQPRGVRDATNDQ